MAGPWEKFGQQAAPEGPWAQFDPARVPQTVAAGQGFGDNGATWGSVQSAAHGALQGLGDETMAAVAALKETLGGGLPFGKAYEQALSMYRGAKEQYKSESPVASTASEMAGGLATGIPMAAVAMPAGAAATGGRVLAQNAAIGAAQGGLYGFNEGEGGMGSRAVEAGQGAALGGALGVALPAALGAAGRAIQPIRSQLNPEQARLAAVAAAEGLDLSPAQLSGSNPLQTMESVFGTLPWTAGPQRAIQDEQRKQFNRAVLSRAGINADNASPEVLDQAFRQIGQKFDEAAAKTTVAIDQPFFDSVENVVREYGRRLPTDIAPTFQSYVDDISQMAAAAAQPGVTGVSIPGREFQNIYSNLRRAARNAKSRPELQEALNELANSLDDAMARTGRNPGNLPVPAGTQTAAANPVDEWQAARSLYRNPLPIDEAMRSTTSGAIGGDIPPTALLQAVQRQAGTKGYTTGQGDLNDIARVGAAFVRDQISNSGTAQRTMMQNLLTGGALTGGGAAMMVDPVTASITAALGIGGPRLAQTIYNSDIGRRYLTNQALDAAIPPSTRRSLARLLAQGSGVYSGMSEDQ